MDWKEKVQWILDDAAQSELAGGSVLVLQGGEEKLFAHAGYANVQEQQPYTKDTIVRFYSMSKTVTAVAVLILAERGQIDLHDYVERYIPGFAHARVQASVSGEEHAPWRPVTIRDLLSMSAGLSYPGETDESERQTAALFAELEERLYGDNPMTTLEIANRLGEIPLAFEPGSHFRYSTCADVAGAIVEVVSGMSFGEFVRKEITEPLGMVDTDFYVPEDKKDRLARAYDYTPEGFVEYPTNNLGIRYLGVGRPGFESGGAGLAGTIMDFAKFATMLMNGGSLNGVRILSERMVRFMTSGQQDAVGRADLARWSNDRLRGYNYGCFNRVLDAAGEGCAPALGSAGEYGWDGWLGTSVINDPKNKITILVLSQMPYGGNIRTVRRIRNVVLSELTK